MYKIIVLAIVLALPILNVIGQTEYFVLINPTTGDFTKIDSLPGVKWVMIQPNYHVFNEKAHRYLFRGADVDVNSFLYTVDALTGSIVSNPSFPLLSDPKDNIIELEYDNSSNILYGLHWDNSQNREYFISINPGNGSFTIIDSIPDVKWIAVGKSKTFDKNNHHYIFVGADVSYHPYLFTIDALTGGIISKPTFPLLSDSKDKIDQLEYDNSTNKLYGLFLDNSQKRVYFILINANTGTYTIIDSLPDVKRINPSYTTFDENNQRYIFCGDDNNNASHLYSVDVLTGKIISNPLFPILTCPSDNVCLLKFDNASGNLYGLHWGADCKCEIVSGQSGMVYNSSMTDSANYTVTISGAAIFDTVDASSNCGLSYPNIYSPRSGISDSMSYITYSFSKTIKSVKVFITDAGEDLGGPRHYMETYLFTTNGPTPNLSVYSGSCSPWAVTGNRIHSGGPSPRIKNFMVTVSSSTAFNTLTISSGINKNTGGSGFGLCSTSIITSCNTTSSMNETACNNYISPSGIYNWTKSGIYYDTIKNSTGCDTVIKVNLSIKNSSAVTISPNSCDNYISPSGKYSWSDPGIYKDTLLSKAGCDSVLTINLTISTSSAGTISTTVCDSLISPSGRHIWKVPDSYQDTILNSNGCDSIITVYLSIINSDTCKIFIPNSFSPNNDGINDNFKPESSCGLTEYTFMVFDRWGEKLFETNNQAEAWFGKYKGEILSAGVYVYLLRYNSSCGNDSKNKWGTINLIR
jgi:gliding motility-associated-like protein